MIVDFSTDPTASRSSTRLFARTPTGWPRFVGPPFASISSRDFLASLREDALSALVVLDPSSCTITALHPPFLPALTYAFLYIKRTHLLRTRSRKQGLETRFRDG